MTRILAVDVGQRRIGVAISDASATLARPLKTLRVTGADDAIRQVAREADALGREEDGLATIVVGLPRALDGSDTDQTELVRRFIDALRRRTAVPIVTEDERLSSVEAESRLAIEERNWRKRKERLDAAAAAVILQDYLDRQR